MNAAEPVGQGEDRYAGNKSGREVNGNLHNTKGKTSDSSVSSLIGRLGFRVGKPYI